MADMDNLFGSDSDDDDDFQPKARPAPEVAAQKAQEYDEPEDEPGSSQPAEYDGEGSRDDGFREGEPERPVGPPLALDAPSVRPLGGGDMHLVRLSNILNIETRPFDLATHEAAEAEVVVDDAGKKRVRLRDQNVIRWRVKLPEGAAEEGAAPGIESNARFVRWSDGSLQLLVGEEALDCAELPMAGDHHFLFLRHIQAQLLEAQGRFKHKLAFRPASLNSRYHRRLAQTVDRSHVKAARVRKFNAVADPAKEKAERERAEEARIRAAEQLERRQNKEMRRYAPAPRPAEGRPRGSSAAASGLTAQYLEAVDAYETEEDEEDDLGLSATERARRNLQRRGMEDEREAEERLARAKRPAPAAQAPRGAPAAKRQAAEGSDLDLGDISGEDDEDDVGAPRTQQRGRQRGLVLSDDED